jgi:shikimate dehydrogenase
VDRPGWQPTAATRVVGVIGAPVRHSLSPVVHNAAFRSLDLDWAYLAFEVPAGAVPEAVAGVRALRLEGLSVTMPHKADTARAVDRLSPAAAALEAVNTVVRQGDVLLGDNTDGAGFLDAVRLDEGFDPAGRRCVVVGAGGAARAVLRALAGVGAAEVVVVNRSVATAEAAVALAPGVARVGPPEAVAEAELVVNATPVGMWEGELPVDPALLGPGQVVVDLVYDPPVTALLDAARRAGAVAVGGVGMLVHQAAHQFRLWTGAEPPLEVMSAAALAGLAKRA